MKYRNVQKASPEQKEALKHMWNAYQALPDDEKQRFKDSAAVKAPLKPAKTQPITKQPPRAIPHAAKPVAKAPAAPTAPATASPTTEPPPSTQ
jgi:hypothetical protein